MIYSIYFIYSDIFFTSLRYLLITPGFYTLDTFSYCCLLFIPFPPFQNTYVFIIYLFIYLLIAL